MSDHNAMLEKDNILWTAEGRKRIIELMGRARAAALQEAREKTQDMKASTNGPNRADWQLGYAAACREIDDMLRQLQQ